MKDEKELAIMIRKEDIKPYIKGLWTREKLGQFLATIAIWGLMGEEPREEDYQGTIEDRYLYIHMEDTMDRISCSQEKYRSRCEKNSRAGRIGGVASGKARALKAAEKRAIDDFRREGDQVDEFPFDEEIEANRSKSKQIEANALIGEANEAKTKTKTTPEKGSGLTSPDSLFSGGNLNLKGGPDTGAEAGPRQEAGPALPGSAAISLDEVIRCAITNKVNLTREGCQAWLENMENSGWMIGNSRVTRKNMLKALRGFAKHFPQWNRHDGDQELLDEEPQPAKKRSYEEMGQEFQAWIDKIGEAPEAGGLSICQKCPDGCEDCYKKDDCKAALKERLEKYLTSKRYKRFADYLDFTEKVSISEYAAFLIPAHKLDMKTRTYCEDIYGSVFPEKGTELIPLSFLDELLDAFDEARPELEKKRQEEEEQRKRKAEEEKAAREKEEEERKAREKAEGEARRKEEEARLANGFYLSDPVYITPGLKALMEKDNVPESVLVSYLRNKFNVKAGTLRECFEKQPFQIGIGSNCENHLIDGWGDVKKWCEKTKSGLYLTDPDLLPEELKEHMEKDNISEGKVVEWAIRTGWVENKNAATLEEVKESDPEFFDDHFVTDANLNFYWNEIASIASKSA